jgi:hydroxyethylthiazole kinase-like uncharacterized protein yjeF
MQKLFEQCYELDARCYEKFALTEDILMEHAAAGLAAHIRKVLPNGGRVLIVAGPGNNGADGITLARQIGGDYTVTLLMPYGAKSAMAQKQYERLCALGHEAAETLPSHTDLIVDALFGAGFSKPLDPRGVDLIERLNRMEGYKLACDIPSGLNPAGCPNPIAFEADATVTMGALKIALFSDHAKRYAGAIEVTDLGLSRHNYESHTNMMVADRSDFTPPRRTDPAGHKGHFGHLAIVLGQKRGAAILAARAAQRFGTGLVTLLTHTSMSCLDAALMQSDSLPEGVTALALGMGLGDTAIQPWIDTATERGLPLIIDADMMTHNALAPLLDGGHPLILTPHPKEFARLLKHLDIADIGPAEIQADRFGWVRRFTERYPHTVLLLKGANTIIADGNMLCVEPFGSHVLSQGGSGDVLAGLIGAMAAQGRAPFQAALQGSLALSLSAEHYEGADYSALPDDLIEGLRWIG